MSTGELTFEKFSEINRLRCESPDGFKHKLNSWSTSDWFLALLGELGEAANVAKKLNRVRDGIPGNKVPEEYLRHELRKELGDAFIYLDLLCQSVGVSSQASPQAEAQEERCMCGVSKAAHDIVEGHAFCAEKRAAPLPERAGEK